MAEPVLRDYTINATGACNGALPSFEGALRKRPTAIANEGTAPAFVSCSTPGDFFNDGNNFVALGFSNRSAVSVTFTCTFVDGFAPPFGAPAFYPQEVTIPANSPGVAIWEPASEGVALFTGNANFNCNLPVGVEINLLEVQYEEDNGVEVPV
jgi:hypothetical protein